MGALYSWPKYPLHLKRRLGLTSWGSYPPPAHMHTPHISRLNRLSPILSLSRSDALLRIPMQSHLAGAHRPFLYRAGPGEHSRWAGEAARTRHWRYTFCPSTLMGHRANSSAIRTLSACHGASGAPRNATRNPWLAQASQRHPAGGETHRNSCSLVRGPCAA